MSNGTDLGCNTSVHLEQEKDTTNHKDVHLENFELIILCLREKILLSLAVEARDDKAGPEVVVRSAPVLGVCPSLRSFLGPKILIATLDQ